MRRLFAIALVFLLIASHGSVFAQSQPDDFGEILDEIGADWDGWAGVSYTLDGISFTDPIGFAFLGAIFSDEDEAEDALDRLPASFNRYLALAYEVDEDVFHEVSAGRLGEHRIAQSATIESDDFEFSIGYVMAIIDEYMVIGVTFGLLISPIKLVVPYVEESLDRIAEEEPSTWQRLRRELPQLSDMPPGYIDDNETEEEPTSTPTPRLTPTPTPNHSDTADQSSRATQTPIPVPTSTPALVPTATSVPTSTPTPFPTPTATPIPPRSLHTQGSGSFSSSDQVLAAGTYRLRFVCNAPGAYAELRWGTEDLVRVETPTYERRAGQGVLSSPFSLDADTTGILITVECSSSWSLDAAEVGTPFPTPASSSVPTPSPSASDSPSTVETGYSLNGIGSRTYEEITLAQGAYKVIFRCSAGGLRNAIVHWTEDSVPTKVVALGYDLAPETVFSLLTDTYDAKIEVICDGDWTLLIDQ